jgi:hypothetical protein
MVSFTSLFVAATAAVSAFAMPSNVTRRAGTGNSSGNNNGYFYQVGRPQPLVVTSSLSDAVVS